MNADAVRKRDFKAPARSPLGDHLRGLAIGYERLGGSEEAKGRALGLRQSADLVDGAIAGQPEIVASTMLADFLREAMRELTAGVEQVRDLAADLTAASQVVVGGPPSTPDSVSHDEMQQLVARLPPDVPPAPRTARPRDGSISRCAKACLVVLVQRAPRTTTRAQLAVWAQYSPDSGGYAGALAQLRDAGYIEGPPDTLVVTEAGRRAAGRVPPLPPRGERAGFWLQRLRSYDGGKCASAVLDVVVKAYPRTLDREEIARLAGYSADSGGYAGALALLRNLELIDGFRASRALMEDA